LFPKPLYIVFQSGSKPLDVVYFAATQNVKNHKKWLPQMTKQG